MNNFGITNGSNEFSLNVFAEFSDGKYYVLEMNIRTSCVRNQCMVYVTDLCNAECVGYVHVASEL